MGMTSTFSRSIVHACIPNTTCTCACNMHIVYMYSTLSLFHTNTHTHYTHTYRSHSRGRVLWCMLPCVSRAGASSGGHRTPLQSGSSLEQTDTGSHVRPSFQGGWPLCIPLDQPRKSLRCHWSLVHGNNRCGGPQSGPSRLDSTPAG